MPALDGTRGFALVLVLMSHSMLISFGWLGVQIFFVLSGFLITRILLQEKEKTVTMGQRFKNFWGRRVLRIFPMYFLYLTGLVIYWHLNGTWEQQSQRALSLFTYTYNFYGLFHLRDPNFFTAHFWSLSVEEQFYIFFPFIVLFSSQQKLKKFALVLLMLAPIYRLVLDIVLHRMGLANQRIAGIIYSSTVSHFDGFMLGACLCIFNGLKVPPRVIRFGLPAYLIFLLLLGFMVYRTAHPGPFDFDSYSSNLGWSNSYVGLGYPVWSYLLMNLLFVFTYLLMVYYPGEFWGRLLNSFFGWPPLVFLGRISYGLYIIHMAVRRNTVDLCKASGIQNKYLLFLVYLPVVILLGWLFYEFYEKRFLKMKEQFR